MNETLPSPHLPIYHASCDRLVVLTETGCKISLPQQAKMKNSKKIEFAVSKKNS